MGGHMLKLKCMHVLQNQHRNGRA